MSTTKAHRKREAGITGTAHRPQKPPKWLPRRKRRTMRRADERSKQFLSAFFVLSRLLQGTVNRVITALLMIFLRGVLFFATPGSSSSPLLLFFPHSGQKRGAAALSTAAPTSWVDPTSRQAPPRRRRSCWSAAFPGARWAPGSWGPWSGASWRPEPSCPSDHPSPWRPFP